MTADRDAAAATALFADDDDIWMSGSDLPELALGSEAIGALHRRVAGDWFTLTFKWDRRRVHCQDDVAWVYVAGTLLVLVRRNGCWRWHTFNGSESHTV